MLHIYAALAEKERRMISAPDQGCVSRCERARRHLGYAKQAEANRNDADALAESLRPINV
jgi:hypothetical protein